MMFSENMDRLIREKTDQGKEDHGDAKGQMHGRRGDPFHGLCGPFSPILAAEDHQPVPQGGEELLVDELNLVRRGHAGEGGFAVGSQHDIVGQIDA